ncbi:acetyl-CoA C-acyltransferase [Saccharopolyspora sp. HNM0983]|uniref:Acetyl-CoA C-acyltransferase n=1 Tax=Saccharopolyspora montiporae TaxID=2781240 RepID=A0A929B915_9PSEU|nr:acetyl-CoA C-acyltransferase [Saccharopolyspora sp. HNM0983]MBE9373287.1 acetyl-CoA C-acyltransferase [Saccharopolyspora sp. HNM0983]
MRDAVIVDAVRTPIGKRNGALSRIHAADLSALTLNALVARTGVSPSSVDDVVWGCVTQVGDQSSNVARSAVLAAGWPEHVPGVTINRACGSGQQAVDSAAHAVLAGQYDLVVAGGVETMSRVPLGAARTTGQPYGPGVSARYGGFEFNQGIGAELIAERWGFSRGRLDEFAAGSHARAAAAIDGGIFDDHLVRIDLDGTTFTADEGLRRSTSPETLAALKPSFTPDGVIHAGNASQISDGAAALLMTTAERAAELGLTPIARYHSGAVSGADPITMLTGPIPATEKVLRRAGLSIDDIGVFEVNEAFAPVPLAWLAETGADPDRVNPLGGAIAVGHPLGGSGAILMTRLLARMRQRDLRYGLQTMCEGGGTANATIIERLR